MMTRHRMALMAGLALLAGPLTGIAPCRAVEITVSRQALERTLKQQLFSGPDGRYYLKGNPHSACFIATEDPHLSFEQGRIVVRVKTVAKLGTPVGGACLGVSLTLPAEVSLAPDAEGETIGFRDAQLDRISDRKEINFVLAPFLRGQVPKSMKVNATELLRKALEGSTASSGYKVSLDRLKIHSVQIEGDRLVVDADGDLSVE
ncbi:MAG: hypothetical protein P4K78_14760 [Terracidiphilus sp.]|nr:hypothetical protein [Terracidiphilus sp.]